jgi:DNA replication and repair protein RecF
LRLHGRSGTGVEFRIEAGMERGGRIRVSVNGKRLSGMADVIGVMPSVIFTPDDISLASGAPANRRMYLDYTAANISPDFLRYLKEYRRVLKHRNAALRMEMELGRKNKEMEAWSEMLVERGAAVARGRVEILRRISGSAKRMFGEVMPASEALRIEYDCSFNPDGGDFGTSLREALDRVREVEVKRGYTLAGPHFDDVRMHVGDIELRRYGSQGQKRVAAIALKLAQAETIGDCRTENPVVLLDDLFSELDGETGEHARELLTGRYQSFITSPRREALGAAAVGMREITVEGGRFDA